MVVVVEVKGVKRMLGDRKKTEKGSKRNRGEMLIVTTSLVNFQYHSMEFFFHYHFYIFAYSGNPI